MFTMNYYFKVIQKVICCIPVYVVYIFKWL